MADDTKTNGETPEQQIEKELAAYDASSPDAKILYLALAEKIEIFCPKNNTINMLKGLKFRIELLKKTPATILHINLPGEKKEYFLESVGILLKYKKNYWNHIKYEFCENLSEKRINDVAEEAFCIVNEINDMLKYHKKIESTRSALLQNGDTHPDYEQRSSAFKGIVDNGKERLEFIIPLFSVWGELGKNIKGEIVRSKKLIAKNNEQMSSFQNIMQRVTKNAAIDKDAKEFEEAYKSHRCRALLSISGAILIGVVTVIWGLKLPWFSLNIYNSETSVVEKSCRNGLNVDDILCRFFSTDIRELLIGGVLLGIMYALLRSYFANAHGESVNRHRCNALKSYKIQIDAARNENEREFISNKATEAIYSHVPTGFTKYHKDENNTSADSTQLAALLAFLTRSGRGGKEGGGSGA